MPSAQVTITQLPAAGPLTGTESVPIVQNGQTRQTTTAAIAASPSQFQTFLTLNQEPTLPNSRALSGSTGITLVDGGALSTLQIVLNGASGSLETAGTGMIAKTASNTVAARTITASGNGLTISNGNGVSGNPTIALSGLAASIANLSGTGIVAISGGSLYTSVVLTGTANQVDVANGTGPSNPTFSISSNPILPGTGSVTLPIGNSAQRPAGSGGQIRYNSQTDEYEVYQNSAWRDITTTSGFVDIYNNGAFVASEDGLNFISGGGITYTVTDDPINNRVDITQALSTSGVVAGAYGAADKTLTMTVDTYGRITLIAAPSIAISNTQVSGLGTMSTQNANNVAITGGSINGTAIGGSSAAAVTGTTITANTQFSGSGAGLTSIPNSALNNSSVTYNGVSVALGASGTITAATPNALTVGTGLQLNSGTTFDGSAAKTISIDSSVVTLTGSQVLTNKTINGPDNTLTNIGNASLSNSSVTYNGVNVALGASGTITAATPNSVTFNNSGTGDASGASFDGSAAKTVSYNTLGAPKADGTGASGTWAIDISGNAATATTATSATSATTANNLAGGSGGSVPYQSGAGATTFLSIGTNGQVITSTGSAPQWTNQSSLSVGSATTATNLAGGAAGSIGYQTGASTTAMLAAGSGVLVGGAVPSYSTAPSLLGTNFSSIPNSALQNSSITIGSTGISLGGTASTLAGLTSVTVTQAPSSALQLATKQYVDDQVSTGIDIHTPVRVEAPSALNATYLAGGTSVTVTDITGSKTLTFSSSPGLSVNDQIVFSSTSNGITAGTAYYVYSAPAGNQVTLSLSYNGPELTTLVDGTGLTIGGLVNAGVGATLTNAGTNAAIQIDGVNLSSTNRVLVYNQANAYENGVYTVTTVGTPDPGGTPWVLTRSTDTDTYKPDSTSGLGQGDYFFVQEGNTGAGESYVMTTSNPIIIGTTNLTFTQFSDSQVYSAGTGLTLSGTQFSLTVPVVVANGGTGLTSYTTGDMVYYATGTALSKLGIGTSTYIMTSTGSAPQWSAPSGITIGTASNIAGGSAGSIPYNTGSGTTTFLGIGTSTYLLTSSGTAPQWSDPAGVTVGSATSATTATNANNIAVTAVSTNASFYPVFVSATTGNLAPDVDSDLTYNPSTNTLTATTFSGSLNGNASTATSATTAINVAGGAAGSLVYQTGASTTTTLGLGTAGYFLIAGASAPQYSDPSGLTVGSATNATNASNIAVTAVSTNASFYPVFVNATTGNLAPDVDSDLTYNPSTNTLTAGTMVATTGIFGGTF